MIKTFEPLVLRNEYCRRGNEQMITKSCNRAYVPRPSRSSPPRCSSGTPDSAFLKNQLYRRGRRIERKTHLGPERSKTGSLEHLPPGQVLFKRHVPDVDFELELSERQGTTRREIWLDECRQCLEFPALNVDLTERQWHSSKARICGRTLRMSMCV